jgi:hypothetical protein
MDSKLSVPEKQQEHGLGATSSLQDASSTSTSIQQDSPPPLEASHFLRLGYHKDTRTDRRQLEGFDYDFDFSDTSELEAAEVGAVVALLLVALLLVLCCCCCSRRGCSLWDLVSMCCLWELCCGGGMGGCGVGFPNDVILAGCYITTRRKQHTTSKPSICTISMLFLKSLFRS